MVLTLKPMKLTSTFNLQINLIVFCWKKGTTTFKNFFYPLKPRKDWRCSELSAESVLARLLGRECFSDVQSCSYGPNRLEPQMVVFPSILNGSHTWVCDPEMSKTMFWNLWSTQLHIWAWLAGVSCPISSFSCDSKHSFLQDSQYKNLLHSFSAAVDLAIHCSYRLLSETMFLTSSCQQTCPTILNAFNIWLGMILQL
jgi:hypothetical protein